MARDCPDCGNRLGVHGCEWCNEESYIVDQYREQGMKLPDEETEFMKKYYKQQQDYETNREDS
jgi:radical SAM superfamily enzyme